MTSPNQAADAASTAVLEPAVSSPQALPYTSIAVVDLHATSEPPTPGDTDLSSTDGTQGMDALSSLPTELLEMILEHALPTDTVIEFAPFKSWRLSSNVSPLLSNFNVFQYQHVARFQQQIRPALGLLSVNKRLCREASRVYYSQNEFRFSGIHGWLILARFFDLIGKHNTQLLKHITVVHPHYSSGVRRWEYDEFFVRQLSPFGMCDLPDYANTYDVEIWQDHLLLPARDPLTTLRGIEGLEKLDLLFYSNFSACSPTSGVIEWMQSDITTNAFDSDLNWDAQPKLQRTLVNLSPRSSIVHGRQFLKLGDAESAPEDAVWYTDLISTRFNSREAAVSAAVHIRAKGWKIADYDWCDVTGIWPLQPDQAEPATEPEKYADGIQAWRKREDLEYRVQDALYENRKNVWVKQADCVKCWRDGGFCGCICDDRPALVEGGGLRVSDRIIGNPGSDLELSADKKTLVWRRAGLSKMRNGDGSWVSVEASGGCGRMSAKRERSLMSRRMRC